jgi:hypothetical protein
MKKYILLFLFFMVAITGCVKDWQCTCSTYVNNDIIRTESMFIEAKKDDAINECADGDTVEYYLDVPIITRCEIQ